MRHAVLSFLLFAGIVSVSRADYVLIRVQMKSGADATATNQAQNYIYAVVDAKRAPQMVKELRTQIPFLEHKFGRTANYFDNQEIWMQYISPKDLTPPAAQYTAKRTALQAIRDPLFDRHLELAVWCVEVGMPDKCLEMLAEIEKQVTASDAVRPSEKVTKALASYRQIKPVLLDEIRKKDKADRWKAKLRYSYLATSKHYALVHNSEDPKHDGVETKLAALENNFKSFYLLFALKGKVLPAPQEKLTAVMTADTAVFRKALQVFEIPERLTDGFHGRLENIVVFAPMRLDKPFERLDQEIRAIALSHPNIELLKGQFRPLSKKAEDLPTNNKRFFEDARAQVFALVEAAMREEGDIATATHEGSRQLIVETGLLPANVDIPEWLRFGCASLFEMTKAPFPSKNPAIIQIAFHPNVGSPNWAWRRYFEEMLHDNLLPDPPTEALFNTLTGYYAANARALLAKPKEVGDMTDPTALAETEVARGRTLAWSLNFYLFTIRFAEYMDFLTEIGNLPRDVEIDQYTFLKLFCQAFKIDTKGLTPENLKGNLPAYADFAKSWVESINRVPSPIVNMKFEEAKVDPK